MEEIVNPLVGPQLQILLELLHCHVRIRQTAPQDFKLERRQIEEKTDQHQKLVTVELPQQKTVDFLFLLRNRLYVDLLRGFRIVGRKDLINVLPRPAGVGNEGDFCGSLAESAAKTVSALLPFSVLAVARDERPC